MDTYLRVRDIGHETETKFERYKRNSKPFLFNTNETKQ